MKVELKGVTIYKKLSEETTAFTGSLFIDGKKAADAKNDGQGGSNFLRFKERDVEKAFYVYAKSLPPDVSQYGELPMDGDFLISTMVEKIADEKDWQRRCRTKTWVKLTSHGPDDYITYPRPYDAKLGTMIREKHPNDLVEIINERF